MIVWHSSMFTRQWRIKAASCCRSENEAVVHGIVICILKYLHLRNPSYWQVNYVYIGIKIESFQETVFSILIHVSRLVSDSLKKCFSGSAIVCIHSEKHGESDHAFISSFHLIIHSACSLWSAAGLQDKKDTSLEILFHLAFVFWQC